MLPWVYGFQWNAFYVIFLGVFFSVIAVTLITLGKALRRTGRDFTSRRSERVMWKSTFEELPAITRACRHAVTGEMRDRVCPNEFDCRLCVTHNGLLAAMPRSLSSGAPTSAVEQLRGFEMPLDRYYHRGHAWARPETDGTITVGLDGLGARLAGSPNQVDLPPVGSPVEVSGTAWRFTRDGRSVRILSPVDGEVVEHGGQKQGLYLLVKPKTFDLRHLLRGEEARLWMLREIERLELSMSATGVGETLADGGTLVDDLPGVLKEEIDPVWGEMFLEP
jgi:hypothetical protein